MLARFGANHREGRMAQWAGVEFAFSLVLFDGLG